ncbi:high affinity cAMP-specific and IBMX-insensitive 3',5'-cyclic phosphodiesterase 8 [Macrosteles quadrilineatus]|uniref:high affinity cAMP-specific and IBMX-insensitive 3',5'-cyclic phosphodiesterase 8 n=1 Tax=Macrosteles quadrilineatus TaxID=74068 RepID=UPI0023E1A69B|nr:high affinity cAMP-specific and IBMX-insensitive 3',5'-cyclic phosphodiesterase 8 [Macrosteles quadrilineatus]XP_054277750.1 high affinity cAMP-specific and IBMX-insensitive 3',5'-cyclic phosphodiesterase 8 [Macrosteles quadrilineatus]XP_054277751.1 high affinity cAMP-specific and IBMX-insensitive 3',5'-cyclic phosphodiesterase 8 [Macrosteles quadrilineatus]XP_054277752.1 high affinity cAMP-specific and IBMX-insensitive 3',5'-cyclic phosphodiesterase 8 [Macrosteles quadrilineatus]
MGCTPSSHKKRNSRDDQSTHAHQLINSSGGSLRGVRGKRGSDGIIYHRSCSDVDTREPDEGGGVGCVWEWCVQASRCSLARNDASLVAAEDHDAHISELNDQTLEQQCHRLHQLNIPVPRPQPIRVLLVFSKDDVTCTTLTTTTEHLGLQRDMASTLDSVLEFYQGQSSWPQIVFVDLRYSWFKGDQIVRALRAIKRTHHIIIVGVCKKSAVEKEKELRTTLKIGVNRVMVEPLSVAQAVCELVQLVQGQVALHALLAHNEAVYLALDKSRDLVLVTDHAHVIQYANRTWCQVFGFKVEELLGQPLPKFHQLANMDQVTRQLEKGFDWEGKISWRSKSGENITLQCRAMPYQAMGREPTHYVYVQDNPLENHIYPRGSVPSIRKGSYDLKSINSEGAQSARRQSLAKLHNLPLEAPITRVISLICAAQENSTGQVVQILDKVVDILRTTELYSSHLKADNLRCEDPVTSDLIGALITSGTVPVSTTRRSSNDSAAVKAAQSLPPGAKVVFAMNASPQIKELLDSALLWDFNIFRLEELTGKRPLVFLGMNLLLHFDVHKTLGCDEKTLYNWLTVIERHYHISNTYHNSSHAADVLQATACFLERERIKKILDELDEACCLIAAACHDIDHPGKSSAFLANSSNELALLYNDISVLESHHAALTFKLTLRDDRVNIFKGLERDTYKVARQSIIDMILATEMTKHFEHLAKFVSVFNKPNSTSDDGSGDAKSPSDCGGDISLSSADEINLVKRMMIKCADVSNPTRPLKMCVEWARRIAEEYFTQTDDEKANHLPVVMPMFDRTSCSIPKSQMGFVDFIINDMFEAWDAFIDMPEMLYHLRSNYQYWKDLEEKGVTSLGDISLKQTSSGSSPNPNLPNIPEKTF